MTRLMDVKGDHGLQWFAKANTITAIKIKVKIRNVFRTNITFKILTGLASPGLCFHLFSDVQPPRFSSVRDMLNVLAWFLAVQMFLAFDFCPGHGLSAHSPHSIPINSITKLILVLFLFCH